MRQRYASYRSDTDWPFVGFIVLVVVVIAVIAGGIGYGIWFEYHDPGHGTITSKRWIPPSMTNSCSGNPQTCTFQYYPECYEINYTDGKHDGDACVSPDEYESYQVGEQYPHRPQPRREDPQ